MPGRLGERLCWDERCWDEGKQECDAAVTETAAHAYQEPRSWDGNSKLSKVEPQNSASASHGDEKKPE